MNWIQIQINRPLSFMLPDLQRDQIHDLDGMQLSTARPNLICSQLRSDNSDLRVQVIANFGDGHQQLFNYSRISEVNSCRYGIPPSLIYNLGAGLGSVRGVISGWLCWNLCSSERYSMPQVEDVGEESCRSLL